MIFDTIPIIASINSFIWLLIALHLLTSRPVNHVPAHLLGINCLLWAIQSLLLVSILLWDWQVAKILRPSLATLLGPALYFYYLVVNKPNFHFKAYHLAHFIPALIVATAFLGNIWYLRITIDYQILMSLGTYSAIIVFNLLTSNDESFKHIEDNVRNAVSWLWIVCGMLGFFFLGDVYIFIEFSRGYQLNNSYGLLFSSWVTLLFTAIALWCFLHRSPLLEWMYSLGEKHKKYSKSKLTQELCDNYFQQLEVLMKDEQLYTQGHIKIVDIARRLNIPARHLSEVVNQKLDGSFPQYLNSYRVEKAKSLLSQSDKFSVTDVMFNAGFNTKSSFNKEFKRIVGISPSAYRNKLSTKITS